MKKILIPTIKDIKSDDKNINEIFSILRGIVKTLDMTIKQMEEFDKIFYNGEVP